MTISCGIVALGEPAEQGGHPRLDLGRALGAVGIAGAVGGIDDRRVRQQRADRARAPTGRRRRNRRSGGAGRGHAPLSGGCSGTAARPAFVKVARRFAPLLPNSAQGAAWITWDTLAEPVLALAARLCAGLDPVRPAADPRWPALGDVRDDRLGQYRRDQRAADRPQGARRGDPAARRGQGRRGGAARRRALAGHAQLPPLAGIGALLGHLFPVWLRSAAARASRRYRGRRSALHWPTRPGRRGCRLASLVAAASTRYSSLGGMAAALAAPVAAACSAGSTSPCCSSASPCSSSGSIAPISGGCSPGTEPRVGQERRLNGRAGRPDRPAAADPLGEYRPDHLFPAARPLRLGRRRRSTRFPISPRAAAGAPPRLASREPRSSARSSRSRGSARAICSSARASIRRCSPSSKTAPPALIVKGDLGLLDRPAVAMVGARNASAAACRFARQLALDAGRGGHRHRLRPRPRHRHRRP